MTHDKIHEQNENNRLVKDCSATLSLLSQEKGLQNWMIAGPEVARVIEEFEKVQGLKCGIISDQHHEDSTCFPKWFQTHVSSLEKVL